MVGDALPVEEEVSGRLTFLGGTNASQATENDAAGEARLAEDADEEMEHLPMRQPQFAGPLDFEIHED
eukprot:3610255-Prorocentrum_lima.AAC.1